MIAALLLAAALGAAQAPGTIAEVRVHGNATLTDDQVVALAGIQPGAPLQADTVKTVEKRLEASDRFDQVQVLTRYRTLAMDQVSIVLLVHERPGVTASGEPPSLWRRLRSKMMFLPIFDYDDGYGWTYGGRTSFIAPLGAGERVSVPLSWGGTRRAAIEAERIFASGPITRVTGSYGIEQSDNPHFDVGDRRTGVRARVEKRIAGVLTFGAEASRANVAFGSLHDHIWTDGADATIDTRNDPAFPSDAVLATAGWNRLHAGSAIDRYTLDARGYKRVFRQIVLAGRARYDTASAPLPAYEEWLLGGSTLRGVAPGAFAGDRRLVWSAELRVPFSSPLSAGRVGFNVFLDGGRTSASDVSVWDAPLQRGAGAGFFVVAPFVKLNFDVAHAIDGRGTRFHFGTGFTF